MAALDKATAQAVAQILRSAGFLAECNQDYTAVEVCKIVAVVTDVNQLVSIMAPAQANPGSGVKRHRRTKAEMEAAKAAKSAQQA